MDLFLIMYVDLQGELSTILKQCFGWVPILPGGIIYCKSIKIIASPNRRS